MLSIYRSSYDYTHIKARMVPFRLSSLEVNLGPATSEICCPRLPPPQDRGNILHHVGSAAMADWVFERIDLDSDHHTQLDKVRQSRTNFLLAVFSLNAT